MLLVLIVIVFVILLDELVMSSAQRRFGPFNIGVFGLFASIVNGVNLLFVQSFFIMSSYSFVMFSLPLLFLFVLLCLYSISMPLYLLDVYFNFFMFVLASSVLVFVYFLLSYSSFSKYSIIGSFRIITQFLAFGLVFDIILAVFSYLYSHSIFSLSGIFELSIFSVCEARYFCCFGPFSPMMFLFAIADSFVVRYCFVFGLCCCSISVRLCFNFGCLRFVSVSMPNSISHTFGYHFGISFSILLHSLCSLLSGCFIPKLYIPALCFYAAGTIFPALYILVMRYLYKLYALSLPQFSMLLLLSTLCFYAAIVVLWLFFISHTL